MDRTWGELRVDDGIIALPKSYAMEKGLQPSDGFPWDSSKDIYLVNGYHGIHCLVSFLDFIIETWPSDFTADPSLSYAQRISRRPTAESPIWARGSLLRLASQ